MVTTTLVSYVFLSVINFASLNFSSRINIHNSYVYSGVGVVQKISSSYPENYLNNNSARKITFYVSPEFSRIIDSVVANNLISLSNNECRRKCVNLYPTQICTSGNCQYFPYPMSSSLHINGRFQNINSDHIKPIFLVNRKTHQIYSECFLEYEKAMWISSSCYLPPGSDWSQNSDEVIKDIIVNAVPQ
jgi:hypothetical protein